MDSLIAAGYDGHLTAFDVLLPPLFAAYDALPSADPRRAHLKEAIETLRAWNRRTSADSVATAVAIFWGQGLIERNGAAARDANEPAYDYLVDKLTDAERIDGLTAALDKLQQDFGRWQIAWGEINRFQRLTDDIVQPFDDAQPSLPVGFAPSQWGALASFVSVEAAQNQKDLWIRGQQLRGGGGFRSDHPCQGHHERRRERRSSIAAFHGSSLDVQPGPLPRRALLSRGRPRSCGAQLSALKRTAR